MSQDVWAAYTTIESNERLRQGDLVRFSVKDNFYEYGVVVTADCDLERRKHSRLVTLVPLLPVEPLVCQCLAYDLFELYREQLGVYCKKKLLLDEKWDDPMFSSLVKAHLSQGISDSELALVAGIFVHAPTDVSIDVIRRVLSCIEIKWDKAVGRFGGQLKDRGDLLVLSPPPGSEPPGSDEQQDILSEMVAAQPRVAWLRALWQEPISAIALRTSDADSARGMRVAQLSSPYRYRLTQMLGQVFSDIGLPESRNQDLADDLNRL